ncbi:ER degradation-enhancing alpha-mannosidase-like protein 2 isoform X2 [Mercenaria mercenaria]|nr:ER degradation-enhancing alpha-mannosidase-like protein 2 isoform X2 [Mercenaria mercenaria]
MFHHAYDGYIRHAYPYDELRPLTCDGHDTWGSYSLTLIDALDMLVIMGNTSEFRRVANLVIEKMDFDDDINVSVFETNIRVVGGLLSAHLMSKRGGLDLEPGWPCSGPLLRMAEDVARRLLPAFDTPTGMPYGTVNLMYGVPTGETTVTCTAGVGTFLVEFGALSKLTGDPIFEKVAMRAMKSLFKARSSIGLVGNHIDVATGKWTALDSGIGGGVDSYFEYLVKGSIMFQNTELLDMYNEYLVSVEKYLKKDDWYMWAHMTKGSISLPIFTSLDCYWPGVQAMLGQVDKAMKSLHNFHQVWKQFGGLPEFYNIVKNEAYGGREGYPLRPELVEAAMYLYQATKDPYLLEIGVDMLESIEQNTKTSCGYATIKDVTTHTLENRMESFFLAETTKYLYLLFDPDNFMHNTGDHGTVIDTPNGQCVIDAGGYIYNTEAHPIDTSALYCCSAEKKEDDIELQNFHDNLDLLTLFDINENKDVIQGVKWDKRRKEDYLDEIMGESLQFLNIDNNKLNVLGNLGGSHQAIMSTKGEKFVVKDAKVTSVTIDGFKAEVNNQDILIKIQSSQKDQTKFNGQSENIEIRQDTASAEERKFEEVCDQDGTCKKVGLELSMKKYTKEENINDPDPVFDTEKEKIGEETGSVDATSDSKVEEHDSSDTKVEKVMDTDVNVEDENKDNVNINTESKVSNTDKVDAVSDIESETVNVGDEKEGANSETAAASEDLKIEHAENEGDKDTIIYVHAAKDNIIKTENKVTENIQTKVDSSETAQSYNIKVKTDSQTVRTEPVTMTITKQLNAKTGTEKFKDVLNIIKSFTEDYLSNKGVKSMKSLHDKLKYYSLFHRQKHELLTCEAQPFHMKFSLMGEMFVTE